MAKYPNQMSVNIGKKLPTNKDNPYKIYNGDAFKRAMKDLKGESFKVWCYLAEQKEGTVLNLGQIPCENATGVKKDTYYKTKDLLIDKGYLVQENDGRWYFYEVPEKSFTIFDF